MVRESIFDATWNAMRDGKFALMRPVITSTDGRCVARIRWMPAARAFCAMRATEVSTSFGATIMRSANSSMTTTMYGSLRGGGGASCRAFCVGALAAEISSRTSASTTPPASRTAASLAATSTSLLRAVVALDEDLDLLRPRSSAARRRGSSRPSCCRPGCRARPPSRAARSAAPSRRRPSAAPGSPSSDRSPPAAAGAGCPRRSRARPSSGRS